MDADTPAWSKELSEDIRAYVREGSEDRKQAAEDRKHWLARWEEDRKQAAEDRKQWLTRWEEDRKGAERDRREFLQLSKQLGEIMLRIVDSYEQFHAESRTYWKVSLKWMARQTRLLETDTRLLQSNTRLLQSNNLLLRRLVSNGRFSGNGSGRKRNRRGQ